MPWLRTAWASFVVGLAIVFVAGGAALVALVTGGTAPVVHRFYRAFARVTLFGFRSHVIASGRDRLEPGRRYVVAVNHQSHLDVPAVILALGEHPVRFVAKQELGRIPIFGAALRLSGTVFVTRSDTRADVEGMDAAQRALLEHVSVLFFAEGTRSATGALGPFKKGAAAFALKSGLPLVPVGIAGSREILPRGLRSGPGGPIAVSIGRPMETRGRPLEDRVQLTDALRAAVET